MEYTTIKIPVETFKLINELSIQAKSTKQEVMMNSLKEYETKLFWMNCNNRYSELINEAKKDDEILDNTLLDGLDDEY